MPFRYLMRYFINNTQMIEKMANSRVFRRAAQLTVYLFHKSKSALEDRGAFELKQKLEQQVKQAAGDNPTRKLKDFQTKFSEELKKEWEKVRGGGPERK